jgi:hypothetical protein
MEIHVTEAEFFHAGRQADGLTDGRTHRQTDRQITIFGMSLKEIFFVIGMLVQN